MPYIVPVVIVGSRPKRVEPSGQLAEHWAETLRDDKEPAQTRLHKPHPDMAVRVAQSVLGGQTNAGLCVCLPVSQAAL
jgi:hypothetical protein